MPPSGAEWMKSGCAGASLVNKARSAQAKNNVASFRSLFIPVVYSYSRIRLKSRKNATPTRALLMDHTFTLAPSPIRLAALLRRHSGWGS